MPDIIQTDGEVEVIEINLNGKYIVLFHDTDAEEAERISQEIHEWLETEKPLFYIASYGSKVELRRIDDAV